MLGNGKHGVKCLLLAVGGVDEGLAWIRAHGGLDDLGVCGVNLQRKRGHALQLRDEPHHDGALVDLRQAGVDVKDLGPGLGLGDGLAHNVVVVAGAQGLLHLLLTRGVDALADDAHLARRQGHEPLGTGHGKPVADLAGHRRPPGEKPALPARVGGGGAAAAADDGDAGVQHDAHGLAVLLGAHVKDGDAVLDAREPGVCLHHDGALCPRQHALDERHEVVGAERAVDTHGVGAQRGERHRGHLGRGAQKRPSVPRKRHGHEGGQVGVLPHGQECGLSLGKVCHGLDDEEVRAGGGGGTSLAGKQLVGVVEGQRAHGLQELPGGADVRGDVAGPRPAGTGHGGIEDLLHRRRRAELVLVSAKGVGGDHVCAGGHIGGVNPRHLFGVSEAEKLGQLAGGKAALLELRTHGAVEHEEVLSVEDALQIVVGHAQAPRLQAGLGPGTVELLCVCHAHLPTLSFRLVCYRR